MSAAPVVEVQGLTKVHGNGAARVEALRGIDLILPAGQLTAVMGSSGSGKSTLLHLLAGLDWPTSGSVRVDGVDLAALTDDERTLLRRRHIGLVFQDFNLLDVLDAEENVALPLAIAGVEASEARRRAARALALVGLGQRGRHRPGQLSGGEQQRVAVARALVQEPLLLLADEPTGNLDSHSGAAVMALLRTLVDDHGHTILMVTHSRAHAALADRLIHLHDGRIVSDRPARHGENADATCDLSLPGAVPPTGPNAADVAGHRHWCGDRRGHLGDNAHCPSCLP